MEESSQSTTITKNADQERSASILIAIEKRRTRREIYETKRRSGPLYSIGPIIGFIAAILFGIVAFLYLADGQKDKNQWVFVAIAISIAPALMVSLADDLDREWLTVKKIKIQLGTYTSYTYLDDYIYTDKFLLYFFYFSSKIICGLYTIVLGPAILVFISYSIGPIAPTTIIIFLLIMILLK